MIRNFFANQSKRKQVVRAVVFLPIAIFMAIMVAEYFDKQRTEHRREFLEKRKQEQAEIAVEAQRRHLEKRNSEPLERPTEFTNQVSPSDHTHPAPVETQQSVEVVTEGPLKGMPVEDAKAFANQHLADFKAEAKMRHQWQLRRKELSQRRSKNIEQTVALALLSADSVDDELQTMLSVFKLMSGEQLEHLRQDLLKTEPANEVNAFFDDLANASTKTPEQITRDTEKILNSREAYKAAQRELQVEWEQILMEIEELNRTKPF